LIHVFLSSALAGGEWSEHDPAALPPGERSADTHRIGGWVGPRAGPDAVEK
jgi:hypothetical protein